MDPVETLIIVGSDDVRRRLSEMALTLDGLLRAVGIARSASANVTPFHCINASGTYSYQQGTWALRSEFVGSDWILERPEGVEAIWNATLKLRIVFSNVDVACNNFQLPKPRSQKGSGAERVCSGNLFGYLPHFAPKPSGDIATYYLMADEDGRAELSRPVVTNGTFAGFIERIYLDRGDREFVPIMDWEDDAANNFDPLVARK